MKLNFEQSLEQFDHQNDIILIVGAWFSYIRDRKAFKLHIKTTHKGKSAKMGQTGVNNDVNKIKIKKDKPMFR